MTYCHNSAMADEYAEEQGRLTARDFALEAKAAEIEHDLMRTPPQDYPAPLRSEIEDILAQRAWEAAEKEVDGPVDDLEGF